MAEAAAAAAAEVVQAPRLVLLDHFRLRRLVGMSNADSKDEVTGTEDVASAPTSAVTSHEALENLMVECKDEDEDTYKCLRMYYLDAEEKNGRIYIRQSGRGSKRVQKHLHPGGWP